MIFIDFILEPGQVSYRGVVLMAAELGDELATCLRRAPAGRHMEASSNLIAVVVTLSVVAMISFQDLIRRRAPTSPLTG